jgi:calcineurin-like phosphoesterase family protein
MIYLIADMHLGCDKLVENTRPMFDSCEEHDELLMDSLNRTVGRDDRLIINGDFCKEKPGRYRPKIKCKNIMFVLGNHDKEAKIRAVFGGNVRWQYMAKIGPNNAQRVFCCHLPTMFWDRSHYGVYHAYGHIHNCPIREAGMNVAFPGRRSMDVGVDSAFALLGEHRPFSGDEFLYVLRNRSGHDIIDKKDRWKKKDYDNHLAH